MFWGDLAKLEMLDSLVLGIPGTRRAVTGCAKEYFRRGNEHAAAQHGIDISKSGAVPRLLIRGPDDPRIRADVQNWVGFWPGGSSTLRRDGRATT
jgi:hypothetical protein